jgi:hypothetical protein
MIGALFQTGNVDPVACSLASFEARTAALGQACCDAGDPTDACDDASAVPSSCDFECSGAWLPLQRECAFVLDKLFAGDGDVLHQFSDLTKTCQELPIAPMLAAIRTCDTPSLAPAPAPALTAGPFAGSALMTAEMQKQVAAWLAEDGQGSAAGWALCYDSPGGDSKAAPSTFHAQCDAHARTLSVAHTEGNGGRTFGGYAEHSWNAVTNTYDQTARANFLFQLGDAAAKYPPLTGYYQFDGPGNWPNWSCLVMGHRGAALGANGHCTATSSCPGITTDSCGGDEGTWGATELEVWYALA